MEFDLHLEIPILILLLARSTQQRGCMELQVNQKN
jgi:hypothetical protein